MGRLDLEYGLVQNISEVLLDAGLPLLFKQASSWGAGVYSAFMRDQLEEVIPGGLQGYHCTVFTEMHKYMLVALQDSKDDMKGLVGLGLVSVSEEKILVQASKLKGFKAWECGNAKSESLGLLTGFRGSRDHVKKNAFYPFRSATRSELPLMEICPDIEGFKTRCSPTHRLYQMLFARDDREIVCLRGNYNSKDKRLGGFLFDFNIDDYDINAFIRVDQLKALLTFVAPLLGSNVIFADREDFGVVGIDALAYGSNRYEICTYLSNIKYNINTNTRARIVCACYSRR